MRRRRLPQPPPATRPLLESIACANLHVYRGETWDIRRNVLRWAKYGTKGRLVAQKSEMVGWVGRLGLSILSALFLISL